MPTRSSTPWPLRRSISCLLAASLGMMMGAVQAGAAHDEEPAAKDEPKVIAKDELKRKLAAAKAAEAASTSEAASSASSSVSMTELRTLIDQKIAEVRAKQAVAPSVKLVVKSSPAKASKPAPKSVDGNTPNAAALAAAHRAAQAAGTFGRDMTWEYAGATGPQSWGQLKPEFQTCSSGKRQSPIDIRDGIKVQLEPIQFDYRPTPFRVIDNGHTVQVNLDPGNSITVSGRRYELVQFHFHRPSEERINGRQYEMVAHLVHKDTEGRLAVVAVLMDQGKEHPMVQLVWNSLPLEKNQEQASPVMLDLNQMLPEQRLYYTYMGSLTTPPCTEGVLWLVMKEPATLSPYQASVFSRMYSNNARPLQATSGRMIKEGQ